MGYFSSGTDGECYREAWCDRCLHDRGPQGCAVWTAHELRNYDECNNDESILHMLIPLSEDGLSNEQCLMFVDAGLVSNLALEKFQSPNAKAGEAA